MTAVNRTQTYEIPAGICPLPIVHKDASGDHYRVFTNPEIPGAFAFTHDGKNTISCDSNRNITLFSEGVSATQLCQNAEMWELTGKIEKSDYSRFETCVFNIANEIGIWEQRGKYAVIGGGAAAFGGGVAAAGFGVAGKTALVGLSAAIGIVGAGVAIAGAIVWALAD